MEVEDQKGGSSNQFNLFQQTLIGDKSSIESKDQEDVESNQINLKSLSVDKIMVNVEVHQETSFFHQKTKSSHSSVNGDNTTTAITVANESEAINLDQGTSFQRVINYKMTSLIDAGSIEVDEQFKPDQQRNPEKAANRELLPLLPPQQQLETPSLNTKTSSQFLETEEILDPEDCKARSSIYFKSFKGIVAPIHLSISNIRYIAN